MQTLLQAIVSGMLEGGIYALVAIGITLVYRSSGIFNFMHGANIVVSAFIFWSLISLGKFPLWACIVITLVISALMGVAVEYLTVRPLIGQPTLSGIMMTLGLSVIFYGIYQVTWGHMGVVNYPKFMPMGYWVVDGIVIGQAQTCALIVSALCVAFFVLYFKFTVSGKQMQAICESHVIAQSVGINLNKVLSLVWVIATVMAMIAAILLGAIGGVGEYLNEYVYMVLPVVILGGLESVEGAFVAAFIVGLAGMISAAYIDPIVGGGFRQVAPYLLLLIILTVRPNGLFGWKRIERI